MGPLKALTTTQENITAATPTRTRCRDETASIRESCVRLIRSAYRAVPFGFVSPHSTILCSNIQLASKGSLQIGGVLQLADLSSFLPFWQATNFPFANLPFDCPRSLVGARNLVPDWVFSTNVCGSIHRGCFFSSSLPDHPSIIKDQALFTK